jgi:hypothetical protein
MSCDHGPNFKCEICDSEELILRCSKCCSILCYDCMDRECIVCVEIAKAKKKLRNKARVFFRKLIKKAFEND